MTIRPYLTRGLRNRVLSGLMAILTAVVLFLAMAGDPPTSPGTSAGPDGAMAVLAGNQTPG